MTARGDDRKLMHWIASHGYTVVRAGSGHWKVYDNGVLLTATSGTPSDWRSRHNFIKTFISLSDEGGDAMTIVAFSFGLIAAFAAHGVCWAFMQMVFPDYTYWLIGA